MTSTIRGGGWAICAVLAIALLAAGVSGQPAHAAGPGDGHLSILVMGDSYSAGNGAGHYGGAKGCRRSDRNYGALFAEIVGKPPFNQPASVTTVACSGDTTSSITGGRNGRPAQLDSVGANDDLVFLTIGGNDLKFAKIVKFCLIARFRDGANCNPLLGDAEKLLKDGTVRKRLTDVLSAIRGELDPRATIVLLGYPYLEGDPDYTMRSGHFGNTFVKVGERLRKIGARGDAIESSVVANLNRSPGARLVFVSTRKLFGGPPNHELYAKKNNPKRWFIQPFVDKALLDRDLFYHPNPIGWQREAELLARTPAVPKTDPVATGGVVSAPADCGTIPLDFSPRPGERYTLMRLMLERGAARCADIATVAARYQNDPAPCPPEGGNTCYRPYPDGWSCLAPTAGNFPRILQCERPGVLFEGFAEGRSE